MTAATRTCPCGQPGDRGRAYCSRCRSRKDRERWATQGVPTHGYQGYTHGCRCGACRDAKREYMRRRRQQGAELAAHRATQGAVKAGDHLKHGSQCAYYEHGCRCPECITWGRNYRTNPQLEDRTR